MRSSERASPSPPPPRSWWAWTASPGCRQRASSPPGRCRSTESSPTGATGALTPTCASRSSSPRCQALTWWRHSPGWPGGRRPGGAAAVLGRGRGDRVAAPRRAGRRTVTFSPCPSTPSSSCSWTRCGSRATRPTRACRSPGPRPCCDRSCRSGRGSVDRLPVRAQAADKSPSWLAHTRAKAFTVSDRGPSSTCTTGSSTGRHSCSPRSGSPARSTSCTPATPYFGAGGRPLATFVARKVRQWPPEIGTSASGEECRNDEVLETTIRLFGGLGYRGLAYLEMKRDDRTGELWIVEPNVGRPTGRSAIAEAGGVELVHTAYCDAAGLPLPAAREQRYDDAKWMDLRRDLQAALVARHRGTLTLAAWLRWVRGQGARHLVASRPGTVYRRRCGRDPHGYPQARSPPGWAAPGDHRLADRRRSLGMNQGADVTAVLGWGLRRYAWLIALFVVVLGVVVPGLIGTDAEEYQTKAQVGPVRPLRIANVDVLPKLATDVFDYVLADPRVKDAAGLTGTQTVGPEQVKLTAGQDNIVFSVVARGTDRASPQPRQRGGQRVRGRDERLQPVGRYVLRGSPGRGAGGTDSHQGRNDDVGHGHRVRPARRLRRRRPAVGAATTRHRRRHRRARVGCVGARSDHPRPRRFRRLGYDPALSSDPVAADPDGADGRSEEHAPGAT